MFELVRKKFFTFSTLSTVSLFPEDFPTIIFVGNLLQECLIVPLVVQGKSSKFYFVWGEGGGGKCVVVTFFWRLFRQDSVRRMSQTHSSWVTAVGRIWKFASRISQSSVKNQSAPFRFLKVSEYFIVSSFNFDSSLRLLLVIFSGKKRTLSSTVLSFEAGLCWVIRE